MGVLTYITLISQLCVRGDVEPVRAWRLFSVLALVDILDSFVKDSISSSLQHVALPSILGVDNCVRPIQELFLLPFVLEVVRFRLTMSVKRHRRTTADVVLASQARVQDALPVGSLLFILL